MHLRHLSLVFSTIQNREVLEAIEVAILPETIKRAIMQSQAQENHIRSSRILRHVADVCKPVITDNPALFLLLLT